MAAAQSIEEIKKEYLAKLEKLEEEQREILANFVKALEETKLKRVRQDLK